VVFLDRDGTINIETHYVIRPEQLRLIPGAASAIARLRHAGFLVVVISNQSAVARGMASVAEVELVNKALREMLLEADPGAILDEMVYCPHGPTDNCNCRKPKTGLLETSTQAQGAVPGECWVVGDKFSDLDFGTNLGVPYGQRLMVLTGHGPEELEKARADGRQLPRCCEDLTQAVEIIIEESRKQ
jgi:D-glycero-D-manno-heptose 1,7-bisphosphate phosphatase